MFAALVTLQKPAKHITAATPEETVTVYTVTQRFAELSRKCRQSNPGFVVYEVLEWQSVDGDLPDDAPPLPQPLAPIPDTGKRTKNLGPRPDVAAKLPRQREHLADVIAFSRVRYNAKSDSGYDQGVLFRLQDDSEIWINDDIQYWAGLGLARGDQAVILDISTGDGPIWIFSGRAASEWAASA